MRREIVQLREVVTKLVPLLAGKGLRVTQIGSDAYVELDPRTDKPKRVNIPNIPDTADEMFIRAVQGFIDHEVAHVLITDFTLFGGGAKVRGQRGKGSDPVKAGQLTRLHNIVEDTMIEREMVKIFPGSRKNIADMRQLFIERITKPAMLQATTPEDEFRFLLVPVMRALAGHTEFQEYMDQNGFWKQPLIESLVKNLSASTLARLPKLTKTSETWEIAKEIHAIIYPPPPPAPPQPAPPPPQPAPPEPQDGDQDNDTEEQDQTDDTGDGESQDKPEKEAGEGDGDGERDHSNTEDGDEEDEDDADSSDDAGRASGDEPGDEEAESDDEAVGQPDAPSSADGEPDAADDQDDREPDEGSAGKDQQDSERPDEDGPEQDEGSGAAGEDVDDDEDADGDEQDGQSQGGEGDDPDDAEEPDEGAAGDAGGDDADASEPGDDERDESGQEQPADDGADGEDGEDGDDASGAGADGDTEESSSDGETGSDSEAGGADPADGSDAGADGEADEPADGEGVEEQHTDGHATEHDQAGGGGVGEGGQHASMFDLDEDALEGLETSRAIAKLLQQQAVDMMQGHDYNVLTREGDRIEKVKVPDTMNEAWVPEMEERVRSMVGRMQSDIERLMASRSRVVRTPGFRTGKLHAPSLHRVVSGDTRAFYRREEHKSKDTAVELVIDNSGSMGSSWGQEDGMSKIHTAMAAGFALSQTLERVNVANEVIGYTTGEYNHLDYQVRRQIEDLAKSARWGGPASDGVLYHRTVPIVMPIYKSFEERLNAEVKRRFAYVANAEPDLASNIDGESLEYAAARLMKRKESRKVMIVLSDGLPAGAYNAPEHLALTVDKLSKSGIDMIGIGIMSDAVENFYPQFAVLNDIAKLPSEVMGRLKQILL